MTPYYERHGITVHGGDCLEVLAELDTASIDAVVTDPPYSLEFMGNGWDRHDTPAGFQAWCTGWATECLRVLRPGGSLVAFGGTRTYHRLTSGIEDAGFEIRDGLQLLWLYGNGMPKGLDVSKAIDKARDDKPAARLVAAYLAEAAGNAGMAAGDIDAAFGFAGRMACQWMTQADWVLVPGWEHWGKLRDLIGFGDEMDAEVWRLNGRKGTPGEAWAQREVIGQRTTGIGTGRGSVPVMRDSDNRNLTASATPAAAQWEGWNTALKPAHEPIVLARKPLARTVAANVLAHGTGALNVGACQTVGRWPANVLLVHAAECTDGGSCAPGCPAVELDSQGGHDTEGPSRILPTFRWEAKAGTAERPQVGGVTHPTVKPLALMRWLVRLVTPPGGLVCDPFAGSGTTLHAARAEGFRAIGIERHAPYLPLIKARLDARPRQAGPVTAADNEPMDLLDLLGDAS